MERKFKTGDSVAYKAYPNICIGTLSPDNEYFHDDTYMIFASDDWFKHFGNDGGTNSLSVKEDEIVLYTDNNTKCVDKDILNKISVKMKEVKEQYLLEHFKTINEIKNTWVGN